MPLEPIDPSALLAEIEAAFADVQLGTWIGLFEAEAIDDYAPEKERLAARAKDRESWVRWQDIPREVLARAYWPFNYTDTDGMRFLAPAFMMFSVKGYKERSFPIDSLIYGFRRIDSQTLSPAQNRAAARFLRFMAFDVGSAWVEADMAHDMYERFWSKFDVRA